jgi:hypothetical protein
MGIHADTNLLARVTMKCPQTPSRFERVTTVHDGQLYDLRWGLYCLYHVLPVQY